MLEVSRLSKVYASGLVALREVSLRVERGEIFALLGPNGAGKTTLISIVCGIVTATAGEVRIDGHDHRRAFRAARALIGLVPQELTRDAFETVWNTVSFSRGLYGKPPNPAHIESVLRALSLWDKRNSRLITLSGGMKRRVLIAKALSHEPRLLFLDEPTAGVDVELRRDMWALVRRLRESGVTIILTTHYLEEAEEMADRVGVINRGELILVEQTQVLMRKLGRKQLHVELDAPMPQWPAQLAGYQVELSADRRQLTLEYGTQAGEPGVGGFLQALHAAGVSVRDLETRKSSLEEIFIRLLEMERP
jgi:ABC-2 type transport system ATP-binding protein